MEKFGPYGPSTPCRNLLTCVFPAGTKCTETLPPGRTAPLTQAKSSTPGADGAAVDSEIESLEALQMSTIQSHGVVECPKEGFKGLKGLSARYCGTPGKLRSHSPPRSYPLIRSTVP
jgi:hypothetical protein